MKTKLKIDKYLSKRFVMRPYEVKDYDLWLRAHQAAMPKQNEFDQDKKTEAELKRSAFLKFVRQNNRYSKDGVLHHYGVFEKKTGRLMGFVLFALVARFNVQSARISYSIFNNYWKHGYGREVVEASVLFGFRSLKLHRIEAEILPNNRPSIALAKSLGFQLEGLRRGAVFFQHEWHDHLIFSILAEDRGIRKFRPSVFI